MVAVVITESRGHSMSLMANVVVINGQEKFNAIRRLYLIKECQFDYLKDFSFLKSMVGQHFEMRQNFEFDSLA